MSEHEPKRLTNDVEHEQPVEGEVIPPKATVMQSGRPAAISAALDELCGYADTRRWQREAKRQRAIADTIEAHAEKAEATARWLKSEEALKSQNLENMRNGVAQGALAELKETELRHKTATNALKLAALEHKARKAELHERIAKARLGAKRMNAKLQGTEKSLDQQIAEAEAEKQSIMDSYADARERDGGTIHDFNEERDFERKLQRINERLDQLYEKQRAESDDAAET